MAFGELLGIEPQELKFPFELNKQISCPLQLSNKTDNYVAFKVKTTNPKKYCVRPNAGIVMPQSTCDVTVVMQGQQEAPPDMRCKDKFLLQSVVANPGMIAKDITPEMFNKESGNLVEECKLRVVYIAPLQLPSPVMEGSDEDSSPPRASSLENGNSNALEFSHVSLEPQDKSSEVSFVGFQEKVVGAKCRTVAITTETCSKFQNGNVLIAAKVKAVISSLTEEKNSAIRLNNKLCQELELLRREGNKRRGSFSFLYVMLIGLLGFLFGYLFRT